MNKQQPQEANDEKKVSTISENKNDRKINQK